MTAATLLALGAALLHATWNLILKRAPHQERDLTSWGLFAMGGLLALPVLVVTGPPGAAAIPWLVLSASIHTVYVHGLVRSYRHGDFSLAYPLARGGGALVAALGGAALLGDELSPGSWAAIAVVAIGLGSLMGREVSRRAVEAAALTAVAIGSYTVVDAHGARVSSSALRYGLAVMVVTALAVSISHLAQGRGPALVVALPGGWRRWLVAGACTSVAYAMVLVGMRQAPVGYVAVLRESSVVFGAAIGWLVLQEPLGGRRLASSLVILAGLIGLIVATL